MKHSTRLPQKTAKSSTRMPGVHGVMQPHNPIPAAVIAGQKRKKLNQRGSTYAAPAAPAPVGGNLPRGTTRAGAK